jgi:hypothetical protein
MRRSFVVSFALLAALMVAGCGSSGSSKAGSATTPPTTSVNEFSSPSYDKAGPNPSKSAKMVCQKEARVDIAANVGVKETSVTKPTWIKAEHLYSCTYVFPKGKITLFVKELSNAKETTAYFESVKKKYGLTQQLNGLGQRAWILKNNDVVVRKDYKVLLVDVHAIPANFAPAMTRSDVALNVGVAILGCWTGA